MGKTHRSALALATTTGGAAPDAAQTTQQLTDSYNANNTVTSYAHAIANLQLNWDTQLMGPVPKWFTDMSANLAKAQSHAQTWIDTLGPQIFATIPQSLINYTNTFNTDMGAVLQMLQNLPPGQPPTAAQQAAINAIVNNVLNTLGVQKQTLLDIQASLVAFTNDVQADHTTLVDGSGAAQKAVGIEQGMIKKIQDQIDIVNKHLNDDKKAAMAFEISLVLGVFITVAAVAIAVSTDGVGAPLLVGAVGVAGIGAGIAGSVIFNKKIDADIDQLTALQQELKDDQKIAATLGSITSSMNMMVKSNEAASQALSTILDMWQTLEGKLGAVATQLQNAEAPEVPAIIESLDLESAQTAWAQLTAFCTAMLTNPVTIQPPVSNVPIPPPSLTVLRGGLSPRPLLPRYAAR